MSGSDGLIELTERENGNKILVHVDNVGFVAGKHQVADTGAVFVKGHGVVEVSESWLTLKNRLKSALKALEIPHVEFVGPTLAVQTGNNVDSHEDSAESDDVDDDQAEEVAESEDENTVSASSAKSKVRSRKRRKRK